VAVVTGGASGIGAATLERLRAAGAVPVSWDTTAGQGIVCDVSDQAAVRAAYRETVEGYGMPTVLVAAAGVRIDPSPVHELSSEDLARALAVNTYGVLFAMQAVTAGLIAAGVSGSVVAVSSVNGTIADQGLAAYSMSKAATNMMVRVMAREVGGNGIRVNAVAPGPTATAMLGDRVGDERYLEDVAARTPLGGLATPEAVADAIVNLIASDWVTGQVLAVDGGSSLSTGRGYPPSIRCRSER
jgi:NAD(P)-dependent dehydrogenase (short-subunit alcohol dehydrogenase family)